jgi:predicted small integral membrane protein
MSDTATPHMPAAEPARKRPLERSRWRVATIGAAAVMLAILGALVLAVPRQDGEWLWTEQMVQGGWMAWSFPIALFFWVIAGLLVTFTLLALRFPETPRVGVLGLETTRGDRLFISLLGSAFINLAWLGLTDASQWWGLAIALGFAAVVFWKV